MHTPFYKSFLTIFVGLFALTLFTTQADAYDLRDWGRKIDNAKRFQVLNQFNDEAVLDRETQLVWQREPGGLNGGVAVWSTARGICLSADTGGRHGWRLPTISELTSLLDGTQFSPALNPGHPFLNVSNSTHWTATMTMRSVEPERPWGVDVTQGQVHVGMNPNVNQHFWCVRGPIAGPSAH